MKRIPTSILTLTASLMLAAALPAQPSPAAANAEGALPPRPEEDRRPDRSVRESGPEPDRVIERRREREIERERRPSRGQEPGRGREAEGRGPRGEPRPEIAEGDPRGGRPGGPGLGPVGQTHRRLHHLTVAIENLRLAGFPEPAERLEREADRLRRRLEGGEEGRREERRIIVRNESGPMPPMRELHAEMENMRAQMEVMRRTLQELQERLKERP